MKLFYTNNGKNKIRLWVNAKLSRFCSKRIVEIHAHKKEYSNLALALFRFVAKVEFWTRYKPAK